jgi:hypothetical protein
MYRFILSALLASTALTTGFNQEAAASHDVVQGIRNPNIHVEKRVNLASALIVNWPMLTLII